MYFLCDLVYAKDSLCSLEKIRKRKVLERLIKCAG